MDLIGPEQAPLGGAKYILSIQDQKSRFGFCYLMKDKSSAHVEFEKWLRFVERKTGKKVKQIQTDNGTEFTNAKFQSIKMGLYIGELLHIPQPKMHLLKGEAKHCKIWQRQ